MISSEFPPMPGGIGNHAYFLAKELCGLGFGVTVLTEQREHNQGEWQTFLRNSKELKIIGISRRLIPVITYFHRILAANRLIREGDWDAVIFSGKFPTWLNAIMPRSKSIVVIHGSEIRQRGLLKPLFYRGLKRAARIVCVSEFTKSELVNHYTGIEIEDVVVINNGIRNDWIVNRVNGKRDDTKIEIVTVGGIHRRKGQFNVIQALPRLIQVFPNAKYHIVGLPVEKERLMEQIRNHKLEAHVIFHHGLSDNEVRNILEGSQVFIMLSEHLENGDFEGFGTAVVEAMALGLPAIGSRNSGIADAIKDGHSGRLVDHKNIDGVIDALREILNDYERYSTNARESADKSRWRNKVKEYRVLIDQL